MSQTIGFDSFFIGEFNHELLFSLSFSSSSSLNMRKPLLSREQTQTENNVAVLLLQEIAK